VKLPNADHVLVDRDKITEYLLNPAHPDNGGKAKFFKLLGFRRDNWQVLASALSNLALKSSVVQYTESAHGEKYVVDGKIATPSGRTPTIRTIWIIDRGLDKPRFVTAYPYEEGVAL
jgi:hypothetical protein